MVSTLMIQTFRKILNRKARKGREGKIQFLESHFQIIKRSGKRWTANEAKVEPG
jgi:hypothetical protein